MLGSNDGQTRVTMGNWPAAIQPKLGDGSSTSRGDSEFVGSVAVVVVEEGAESRSTRLAVRQEAVRAAGSSVDAQIAVVAGVDTFLIGDTSISLF